MVIRPSIMNDEEDLEALRLAALQTIRPRFPKVSAPFIRPSHNPNLIAIVPTVPVTTVHSATNGSSSIKKLSPAPNSQASSIKECLVAKQDKEPKEKERKIERIKLDLDEDVLDFEGDNDESDEKSEGVVEEEDEDAVALHADDEDSLEKLMDKMEEELSEEPLKKNVSSIAPRNSAKATTNGQTKVVASTPPSVVPPATAVAAVPTAVSVSSKARSRSPPPPPIRRRSRSPYVKKWSPRSRSRSPRSPHHRMRSHSRTRSKSPLPPLRRPRSPLRARSRTPPLRRGVSRSRSRSRPRLRSRSRSPVFRRSRTPPKYARRSPPLRNPRRSRSRSRSWPSPRRDYRSPPRRPIISRKRSPSPGRRSLSCERKFRRSVSPRKRSLSPVPEKCRRKRSPLNSHRRHHGSGAKRSTPSKTSQRSQRLSPLEERKSPSASSKPSADSLPSLLDLAVDKKSVDHSSSPNGKTTADQPSSNQTSKPVVVDSKLEARRRKFESTALVAALPKKIRLKATIPTEGSAELVIAADEVAAVQDAIKEKLKDDDAQVQAVVEAVVRQLQRQKPVASIVGDSSKEPRRLISLQTKKGVTDRASEVKKVEEIEKPKLSVARFTVADAEKEIRQLKLKKRQIVDLDGDEEETTPDVAVVVEKHKRRKKKKKEKRAKKEGGALIESALAVETETTTSSSVSGSDLRAEISRRRAERLKGQVKGEAIVRIVQSAFEGVVGKKKVKKSGKEVLDTEEEWPKSTGGRRVQLLQPRQKLYSKTEKSRDINEEEDSDIEETEVTTRPGGSGIGGGSSGTSTGTGGNAFRGMLQ